jgi:hypothetical protein
MDETPDISPLIRRWLPNASIEEQTIATQQLRRYLAVVYRICQRLEMEGGFPLRRDKLNEGDRLEVFTDHVV